MNEMKTGYNISYPRSVALGILGSFWGVSFRIGCLATRGKLAIRLRGQL